jgi:hypothetical protein
LQITFDVYKPSTRPYRGIGELSYPFHDRTALVTCCGRICLYKKKINLSTALAGQAVGIKEIDDGIWLVSFMDYDLGYIDLEEKTLQPLDTPFGPRVQAMSQERSVKGSLRTVQKKSGGEGGIRTPGRSFGPYNGLANSRFHTLLFGINRLRSEELPYCWAKSHCSAAIVQLLCNQNFNGLSDRRTSMTSARNGACHRAATFRRAVAIAVNTCAFVGTDPTDESIIPACPFFIPYVLKRSDRLTKYKKHLQLDVRIGLQRRFYSVSRPWSLRSCFLGWARISGMGELLGGAFSTRC